MIFGWIAGFSSSSPAKEPVKKSPNNVTQRFAAAPKLAAGRCCLLSPLPLRERAQWSAREIEWVRGSGITPHPSSHVADTELPSPARGEGAITSTAPATLGFVHRGESGRSSNHKTLAITGCPLPRGITGGAGDPI